MTYGYFGIMEEKHGNYYLGSRVCGFPKLELLFGGPIMRVFWGQIYAPPYFGKLPNHCQYYFGVDLI